MGCPRTTSCRSGRWRRTSTMTRHQHRSSRTANEENFTSDSTRDTNDMKLSVFAALSAASVPITLLSCNGAVLFTRFKTHFFIFYGNKPTKHVLNSLIKVYY